MDRRALQNAVEEWVGRRRDELVENTARLLQFETISGESEPVERERREEQMAACGEFLRGLAERMGFRWVARSGEWYCAEWSAGEPRAEGRPVVIGIPTHIDVVPAGGTWIFPPFSGAVADGAIWGRGAVDMKGPLMACLYALRALKEIGWRPPVPHGPSAPPAPPVAYRLIVGTREEIVEWSDIAGYLEREGPPDFGFTPDACFPVVTGEKGTLTLAARATWPLPRPSTRGIEPVLLSGGTRGNVVPDFCELVLRYPRQEQHDARLAIYETLSQFDTDDELGTVEYRPDDAVPVEDDQSGSPSGTAGLPLGPLPGPAGVPSRPLPGSAGVPTRPLSETLELRILFHGKSAHGSTPEKGHNAALDALRFLLQLGVRPGAFREFARFAYEAGADFAGGALGLVSSHEFLGPTTVNLGIVRIERGRGKVVFNVRPTLGLSVAEAERRIASAARAASPVSGLAWEFERVNQAHEPMVLDTSAMGPFLSGLQEGFTTVTGLPAPFRAIPYTTYAKTFPNCCAFGPVLLEAGEDELAHQPNERVAIDALVRNTKIYALSLAFAAENLTA